tara:strand:- start:367 stop:489 length:123 start_codon:yes stop_codon:yes gene_type:complete
MEWQFGFICYYYVSDDEWAGEGLYFSVSFLIGLRILISFW